MDRPSDREPGGADRRSALRLGALAAGAAVGADFLLDAPEAHAQARGAGGAAVPNLYPRINARQFQAFQRHENAHVAAIQALITSLGGTPRPKPNFRGLTPANIAGFATLTRTFANVGTGAYNATAPLIFSRSTLQQVAPIALIEARHTGYINTALNFVETANVFGAEQDFDAPLTREQVLDLASPFIADLNGGPPPTFNQTPSPANDLRILNFALVLEYLEQEFYNINVPRFFPS